VEVADVVNTTLDLETTCAGCRVVRKGLDYEKIFAILAQRAEAGLYVRFQVGYPMNGRSRANKK